MWIQPSTLSATMLALPQRHCWSAIMLAPGDLVKVVADDFAVKSFDAKGWVGKVTEVRGEPDAEEWGACCELAWEEPELVVAFSGLPVTGYFEESEVRRLDARGGSAPITEGDRVKIIRDVTIKGGVNANGRMGTVTDAWVICETDPACCCAELTTAPLTVLLDPSIPTTGDVDDDAADAAVLAYLRNDEVEAVSLSVSDTSPA